MDKISKLLEETQNLLDGFSSGTLSPVSSYFKSDSEEFEEESEDEEAEDIEESDDTEEADDTEAETSADTEASTDAEATDTDSFTDTEASTDTSSDDSEDYKIKMFRNILKSENNFKILNFIESFPFNLPKKSLHICIEINCKNLEIFKSILRNGCDPLELNSDGKTALTILLEQKENNFEEEESNCLISTLLGEWELRRAATNNVKIFKFIHSKDWKGFFKYLKEFQSNQHHQKEEKQKEDDVINLLSKPDPKYAGISPLHEIAAMNDVKCLKKILLEYKHLINLNIKSIGNGNTLLHEAAHMSSMETVKLLIEFGARCDIKNASGRIPSHLGTEKIQVIFEFKYLSKFKAESDEKKRKEDRSKRREDSERLRGYKVEDKLNERADRNENRKKLKEDKNKLREHKQRYKDKKRTSKRKDDNDLYTHTQSHPLSSKKTAELFVQSAASFFGTRQGRTEIKTNYRIFGTN